ncbi:MAG: HD domain-containing protein [Bacillota bacterium]
MASESTTDSGGRDVPVRPLGATIYALVVIVGAGILGWYLRGWMPDYPWTDLLFFLVMIAVTEALPIDMPGVRGTVSVSFAMCYSSAVLFGPFYGGLLTAIGSIGRRELSGKIPFLEVMFNRAQLFIAAASGGLAFFYLWDGASGPGSMHFVFSVLGGGIAYFATNMAAFSGYLALSSDTPFLEILGGVRWAIPSYMGLLPIAYLNVAVYDTVGILGILVFLFPLMVGRYAFKMYRELREVFISTISALAAALEARDPHTSGHAERVAKYAVQVGQELDLDREHIDLLEYVAILHDIGKIGIPDHILQKPGAFTEGEWRLMRRHSSIGASIISRIKQLEIGADWVLHHHERYDGRGYPDGLAGDDIALEARILAVVDSLDAMMSDRPYKRAMTATEAREEIVRCSGTQFDPQVVEAVLRVLAEVEDIDEVDTGEPKLVANESFGDGGSDS